MKINVHAGHNLAGKIACGAVGIINESVENRKVKDEVIRLLRAGGHTVYDCTVDNGTSQNDVLTKIVKKCNAHSVDLDVSIHFNAGRKDDLGDGRTGGTEVYVYGRNAGAWTYAQRTAREINKLGYPIRDDGVKDDVKEWSDLYVLKYTKAPAMLVECCFVDDKDDVEKYHFKSMAQAIAKGITGEMTQITEKKKNELYYPRYMGNTNSIVMALQAIGVESGFSYRKKIAIKNQIKKYQGTAKQNVRMLSLLKSGKLKRL